VNCVFAVVNPGKQYFLTKSWFAELSPLMEQFETDPSEMAVETLSPE
jgi:hypothetical protein